MSQYYQPPALLSLQLIKQQQEQLQNPQTLAQILGLQNQQYKQPNQPQQPPQLSPFLYLGQISLSDTGEQIQSPSRPQSRQLKTKSDDHATENQEENTYILYRPSADEPQDYVDMAPPPKREEPNYYAMLSKPRKFKKYVEEDPTEKKLKARKDNGKLKHQIKRSEVEGSRNDDEYDSLKESSDYVEQSEPTSRLDFQMHGNLTLTVL